MPLDPEDLAMLEGRMILRRTGAEDQWGNATFSADEVIACFFDQSDSALASGESNETTAPPVTRTASVMTDAIGIKPLDLLLAFTGSETSPQITDTYEVVSERTTNDQTGQPLYQEVSVSTATRG